MVVKRGIKRATRTGVVRRRPRLGLRQTKYQGREIQSTIQANTLTELNRMISGMRAYARTHKMGPTKILRKGRDPDGGYKAIITAHNENPPTIQQLLWGSNPDPETRRQLMKRIIV